MLEIFLYVIAGCLLGVVTGMIPGIHINTVSAFALGVAVFGDFNLVILIVAMSVVHTFVDFIPSILLGAPDSETFIAVLPGHRMLNEGRGFEAVKLSAMGGLVGGLFSVIISPVFFLFINNSIEFVKFFIPWMLIVILGSMILSEKTFRKKRNALLVVILSAFLGVIMLKGNFNLGNALLPLATGFFGAPILFQSIMQNQKFAPQKNVKCEFDKREVLKGSFLGLISGAFVSLIPSIGPAQAVFVTGKFFGNIETKIYLVVIGSINTVNMILSFIVLYALGKTRTGSAAAIKGLFSLQEIHLIFLLGTILISLGFGYLAVNLSAQKMMKIMRKINYKKLNFSVLFGVSIIVFVLSGFVGYLAYLSAACIGIYCQIREIRRINCMAFLMVPTILIYLNI